MAYLIDTNIVSELAKDETKENQQVIKWFNNVLDTDLYLSVLTIGEIRKGIIQLQNNKKQEIIRLWLEQSLVPWFVDRLLPIDQYVANKWGFLQAQIKRTVPAIDSLIAATALHHDLILVTRNETDFMAYTNLEIINPFNN